MSEPSPQELKESIEALSAYRDRLQTEVTSIAQKLQIPKRKIDSTLAEHSELIRIETLLSQLIEQYSSQSNHSHS